MIFTGVEKTTLPEYNQAAKFIERQKPFYP